MSKVSMVISETAMAEVQEYAASVGLDPEAAIRRAVFVARTTDAFSAMTDEEYVELLNEARELGA